MYFQRERHDVRHGAMTVVSATPPRCLWLPLQLVHWWVEEVTQPLGYFEYLPETTEKQTI